MGCGGSKTSEDKSTNNNNNNNNNTNKSKSSNNNNNSNDTNVSTYLQSQCNNSQILTIGFGEQGCLMTDYFFKEIQDESSYNKSNQSKFSNLSTPVIEHPHKFYIDGNSSKPRQLNYKGNGSMLYSDYNQDNISDFDKDSMRKAIEKIDLLDGIVFNYNNSCAEVGLLNSIFTTVQDKVLGSSYLYHNVLIDSDIYKNNQKEENAHLFYNSSIAVSNQIEISDMVSFTDLAYLRSNKSIDTNNEKSLYSFLARFSSDLFSGMRYNSYNPVSIHKIAQNTCPYPRMKFFSTSYFNADNYSSNDKVIAEILNNNQLHEYDIKKNYLSGYLSLRGDFCEFGVANSLNSHIEDLGVNPQGVLNSLTYSITKNSSRHNTFTCAGLHAKQDTVKFISVVNEYARKLYDDKVLMDKLENVNQTLDEAIVNCGDIVEDYINNFNG